MKVSFSVNKKPIAFYDLKTKQISLDIETMDMIDWGDLKKNAITYFDWLMYCWDHSAGKVKDLPQDKSVNHTEN